MQTNDPKPGGELVLAVVTDYFKSPGGLHLVLSDDVTFDIPTELVPSFVLSALAAGVMPDGMEGAEVAYRDCGPGEATSFTFLPTRPCLTHDLKQGAN